MQVINLLPTARPRVDDRAEARFTTCVCHAQLIGKTRRQNKHSTKQRRIALGAVTEGGNVLARDHQHMGLGRRTDVAEGDELVVFVDFGRRNLAGGDLAKETVRSWLIVFLTRQCQA